MRFGWLGTIATRIIAFHVAAIGIAGVAAILVAGFLLRHTFVDFEHRSLNLHAAEIAADVRTRDGKIGFAESSGLDEYYSKGYDGFAYAIVDEAGLVRASSRKSGAALLPRDPRSPKPVFFYSRDRGASYFIGSYPARINGRPFWIEVRQNLEHPDVYVDDILNAFVRRVAWVLAATLAVLLAIDVVIIQRLLAPVRIASEEAAAIDPTRIGVRLPTWRLPSEIKPLVVAINQALDRLERGFRMQREFIADAAHELRTPLTLLGLKAEALTDQSQAAALKSEIGALRRLVDQLLALAELDTLSIGPDDVADLRNVAVEVSSQIAPLAIAARKRLALEAGDAPVWVRGKPELISRALRNLVENAIAHTPVEGAVTISLTADGRLLVSDEGPGVADSERELIFQRFWRRNRQTSAGSGLGLSIVRRIQDVHGGSVEVGRAACGGARFVLGFELAPSPGYAKPIG